MIRIRIHLTVNKMLMFTISSNDDLRRNELCTTTFRNLYLHPTEQQEEERSFLKARVVCPNLVILGLRMLQK